ncbi:hypothetical protein ACFL09_04370, partial [Planctomycetota bacterium]
ELESILNRLEPEGLVARTAWLFSWHPRPTQVSRGQDWGEQQEMVSELRCEALKEILAAQGLEGILDLARQVELPKLVGSTLTRAALLDPEQEILPHLLGCDEDSAAALACGCAHAAFVRSGWEWVEGLPLSSWSPVQASALLLELPFESKTWDLAEKLGDEVLYRYWTRVRAFCRRARVDEVERAVTRLLERRRPVPAIEVVSMALHDKVELPASLVMDVLEAGLLPADTEDPPDAVPQHFAGEIRDLFSHLQSSPEVDQARLGTLEWGYLRVLDGHFASPQGLHRWLQGDPQAFVDMLRLQYRSRHDSPEDKEPPTDEQLARARKAWEVLHSWRALPGAGPDGSVDGDKLAEWVDAARGACEMSGHLEVCDILIGEVLAHSPEEADGTWPCSAVRDLLERVQSDRLVHGFEIGTRNKRGPVWRSLTEGGAKERELAAKFREHAEACSVRWPIAAAALRRVADSYEWEARREDEEAQGRL